MFALTQVFGAPILNSFGSGAVDYPSIGAVIGWFLVAALVGSFLGILRESFGGASGSTEKPGATVHALRHAHDEKHLEAA